MSELLALSFDVATSPTFWLHKTVSQEESPNSVGSGWGIAWYPNETTASVFRDPRPISDVAMAHLLQDWDRFRGTVFLCHIRGAAKRPNEQDTHPFTRTFAGRTFSFAHNGLLEPEAARGLGFGKDSALEPLGSTDSEQAFCWMLSKMKSAGARNFADIGYEQVHAWLHELNELGTLSVIMSDGQDLIAYSDRAGVRPLHGTRLTPPHETTRLDGPTLALEFSHPLDTYRTLSVVATNPLSEGWSPILPGEMIVTRRGAWLYSSGTSSSTFHTGATKRSSATGDPAWQQSPILSSSTNTTNSAALQHHSIAVQPPANGSAVADSHAFSGPKFQRYDITHRTSYRYGEAVERSTHTLRLQPLDGVEQRLIEHSTSISVECELQSYEDVFGNRSQTAWITKAYDALEIVAHSIVEVRTLPLPTLREPITLPMVWMPWQRQMMTPFLLPLELPETQLMELSDFAMSFAERQNFDAIETLRDINTSIRRDFQYMQGVTSNETTPFEVYVNRRGVCQDFANLFICLARLLGVAARYRVGYIHTGSNYENQLQSEASHAWAEVYLPRVGWRGFDPTNGCIVGQDHVSVAAGRHYRDATPTSGTLYQGGRNEQLIVDVKMHALGEGE